VQKKSYIQRPRCCQRNDETGTGWENWRICRSTLFRIRK